MACPTSYSFPSIHAAAAFALMLSFINKQSYPVYLLFGLFVSFTRIYLGVHQLEDITASLAIAAVCFYAFDILVNDSGN